MNNIQSKILCNLKENKLLSQRQLAKNIGVSLGIINREYNELISSGFLTEEGRLTKKHLRISRIINQNRQSSWLQDMANVWYLSIWISLRDC